MEQSPLLPKNVHATHRLGPHPIRFPVGSVPKSGKKVVPVDEEAGGASAHHGMVSMPPIYKSGLPKISRECLVSECICYGKYIAAVFAVFGVGGILLALWMSGRL
jgi:hypothetical protein